MKSYADGLREVLELLRPHLRTFDGMTQIEIAVRPYEYGRATLSSDLTKQIQEKLRVLQSPFYSAQGGFLDANGQKINVGTRVLYQHEPLAKNIYVAAVFEDGEAVIEWKPGSRVETVKWRFLCKAESQ